MAMNKQIFLAHLRKGLSGFPQDEIEERLTFYSEMIEDRMEEGLSEKEAISAVGSVDEIISQVMAETPLVKIAKEKIKPKRKLMAWEIILLVLSSPIWLSLGIAAAAVILSLCISLWSIIISLLAVFASLAGCSLCSIIAGIILACSGYFHSGMAMIGTGFICAGLSIFMFYGCRAATKGIVMLTKKIVLWIKSCFIQKEEA